MPTLESLSEAARAFLAQRKIAVVGVSRSKDQPANLIYRKLRDTGHQTYAVNPAAEIVEGDRCFPDLAAAATAAGGLDALMIATPPAVTTEVMRQAIDLGIEHVWIHRAFGPGSYSEEAVELGLEAGLRVIPGGCPMMFTEPVDVGHKCMRWLLSWTGKLPSGVEKRAAA